MSRWPDALRRAPPRWWEEQPPGFDVVRALSIETPALARRSWDRPALRQLRHLRLRLDALGPGAETFFRTSRLVQLQRLDLVGPAPLGFDFRRLSESCWLPGLTRLRWSDIEVGPDLHGWSSTLRRLEALEMDDVRFSDGAVRRLASVLKADAPSVLHLRRPQWDGESSPMLLASDVFRRVVELSLVGCGLEDRSARGLAFALETDALLQLDLGDNPLSDTSWRRLTDRLRFPVATHLGLAGCHRLETAPGLSHSSFPVLRSLDLTDVPTGGTAGWARDPALLANLESLAVAGAPGLASWFQGLSDGRLARLERLRACPQSLDGLGLARLAGAAPRLREVEVPGCRATLGGWIALLHRRPARVLDVSGSEDADDLMDFLARWPERGALRVLRVRRLGASALSERGFAALADLAEGLTELDLGGQPFDCAADALRRGHWHPHRLRLSGCRFGPRLRRAMIESGILQGVRELWLDGCGLGRDEVASLAAHAPWLETLFVDLDAARSWQDELQDQFPTVRLLPVDGGRGR
ncbi:MAG: hypothetical protein ACFB9M_13270 [Myxococcota bacterium]